MIAGLILAGGQGLRMGGRDKSLLRLGSATLVEHLTARLALQVRMLALNANGDPARFAATGLPVLADTKAGLGPLAGVLRGLEWAGSQGCTALLTVPCDTPFIPADLARRLLPAPSVAASRERLHHAVALWPVGAHGALRASLGRPGSRSVRDFGRTLGMRVVDFSTEGGDPFFNINTADDLAAACDRLRSAPASPQAHR